MAALSKTQRRKRRLGIVGDVYAILIYTVLYIPVAVMMVFSFNDQKYNFYWNGFTTEWYGKLLENDALIGSLWYSLIIAVLATVISVVIGTLGALGLKRYEFKGKRFINSMLYVPIIVPEIVLAVALLIIFMNIGLSLGLGSILVGHCTFCIPYAVVTSAATATSWRRPPWIWGLTASRPSCGSPCPAWCPASCPPPSCLSPCPSTMWS